MDSANYENNNNNMDENNNTVGSSRLLPANDGIIENAAVDVFESIIADDDGPNDNEDIRWLREERLHHQSKAWHDKPTVFILSLALLLNFTSMGVSISAKVMLMMDLICRNTIKENPNVIEVGNCRDPLVQGELSSLSSIISFFSGGFACLMSGKMGELSDRFGRKPVFMFVGLTILLGRCFNVSLLMEGRQYHKNLLLLACVIENFAGGNPVLISVASSYITDIVEPHQRIVSLGFMVGTLYGGLAIGPILGNLIIKYIGHGHDVYALYAEVVLCVSFVLVMLFFVKESRPMKLRRKSQSSHLRRKASFASSLHSNGSNSVFNQLQLWRIADIFAPVKKLWLPKHPEQGFKPRYNILILLVGENVMTMAGAALTSTLILYATYTFNWSTDNIGYYVSVVGFAKAFCLYVISPVLLHFLKKSFKTKKNSIDAMDITVITVALIFDSCGPLIIIFATNGNLLYVSALFASLGALGSPTIQSSIVKYVSESQTGEIFGAMAFIRNVLLCLGPPLFLQVYAKTVGTAPTAVFWLNFVLFVVSILLLLFVRSHPEDVWLDEDNDEPIETTVVDTDVEEGALIHQTLFFDSQKGTDPSVRSV